MFQYIVMALFVIVGLTVAINVVKGLLTGMKKTVGSLIAIILSAVAAFIVTLLVCKPSSALVATGLEFLKSVLPAGTIQDIFTVEELGEAFSYYSAMLVSPFFFTVAFIVISIVMSIVVAIIVKIIPPFKKSKALFSRLGGALIGLVCGILVAVILVMPVVGTVDLVASMDSLTATDGKMMGSDEVTDLVHEAAEDKTIDLFLNLGCGSIYDYFASTDFEGEKIYLKDDFSALIEIVDNIDVFKSEVSAYGDTEIEAFRNIVSNLETSPLLENTVAGIFSTAAEKWTAGEAFIGIEKPSAGEMLDPIIDTMLGVLSSSDKNNIGRDLETMADVFAVMIKHKMIANGDNLASMLTSLSETNAISELIVVINENERMSPLADEITSLSIRALASTIGIPENDQEGYDLLMNNIADIVTSTYGMGDEERITELEGQLSSAFEHYGVEIGGEALNNITASIISNLGDKTAVEASDVEEFFRVYAVANAESASFE